MDPNEQIISLGRLLLYKRSLKQGAWHVYKALQSGWLVAESLLVWALKAHEEVFFISFLQAQGHTEMEATDMDVEEQPSSNLNPNSCKRFGLKNSIQTNFGDDYVFQIVPKYGSFCFFSPLLWLNFPLLLFFLPEKLWENWEEKKIIFFEPYKLPIRWDNQSFQLGSWVLAMRLNFCAFPTLSLADQTVNY